ncbi:MAG: glucokinase [Candidatus Binatia bacterium]|nr:glucokinase [Candidatus Binatia bacterium]
MILAGDIGGTKTVLALFEQTDDGIEVVHEEQAASQGPKTFDEILEPFLSNAGRPPLRGACFAVAGPVVDGACETTNLPWSLDEGALASTVRAPRVKLLNDLEGTAYGVLHLPKSDLVQLNVGRRPRRRGNIAVIAAGTGLGEAYLYWDGGRHRPIATEGGHSDFAPRTEQEVDLLHYLRRKLGGRVSCERVLSGPGVYEIYEFLRDTGRQTEPAWLAEKIAAGDPSATVSGEAAESGEAICLATMNLFCELYGAEAGNMALRALTYGGVFVGGGIAPKNLSFLTNGSFLRGFTDKGRFTEMMMSLDVWVSTNPRAALLGAAYFADEVLAD